MLALASTPQPYQPPVQDVGTVSPYQIAPPEPSATAVMSPLSPQNPIIIDANWQSARRHFLVECAALTARVTSRRHDAHHNRTTQQRPNNGSTADERMCMHGLHQRGTAVRSSLSFGDHRSSQPRQAMYDLDSVLTLIAYLVLPCARPQVFHSPESPISSFVMSLPPLPHPPAAIAVSPTISNILVQSSQRFDQLMAELDDIDKMALQSHVDGQTSRRNMQAEGEERLTFMTTNSIRLCALSSCVSSHRLATECRLWQDQHARTMGAESRLRGRYDDDSPIA
jgi:hypothetical protein